MNSLSSLRSPKAELIDTEIIGNCGNELDPLDRGIPKVRAGDGIVVLTDDQWCQASLPTAMGGLGLRCAVDHAPVAHAVSLIAAQPLLDGLLGEDVEEFSLPQPLLDTISAQIGEDTTVETLTGVSQKKASLKVDILKKSLLFQRISEGGDVREIARMASLGLPHAGSWLSVVPSPPLSLLIAK